MSLGWRHKVHFSELFKNRNHFFKWNHPNKHFKAGLSYFWIWLNSRLCSEEMDKLSASSITGSDETQRVSTFNSAYNSRTTSERILYWKIIHENHYLLGIHLRYKSNLNVAIGSYHFNCRLDYSDLDLLTVNETVE